MSRRLTEAVRKIALEVVDDPAYKERLKVRAMAGTLPPAVESMLWHYAFGKPIDRLEVTDKTHDLANLSDDQLAERAEQIRVRAVGARRGTVVAQGLIKTLVDDHVQSATEEKEASNVVDFPDRTNVGKHFSDLASPPEKTH